MMPFILMEILGVKRVAEVGIHIANVARHKWIKTKFIINHLFGKWSN